jgi:hypothetical protein
VNRIEKYFEEHPNSEGYVAVLETNENPKVCSLIVLIGLMLNMPGLYIDTT